MDDPARWSELWRRLGAENDPQPVFEHLARAYAEPQRAYHTLEHIRDCLAQFDQASMLAERPVEVETALWLHDVVYNPRAPDNEERSAEWAEKLLRRNGVTGVAVERIRALILATKHQAPAPGGDAALLVDIDLSILGMDVEIFERYEQKIGQEYSFVPEQAFREGRIRILESFLKREFIYQTSFFRERYEAQARENLLRSIEILHSRWSGIDSV
jgi:predicted metal-dependent HD superfamily phosphohydrolase